MLDQNTDRMWFVIGAVIVGAAIIFIANGTLPELFASITGNFEEVSTKSLDEIAKITPYSHNLFDPDSLIYHHWINHNTGQIYASNKNDVITPMIVIEPGMEYIFKTPNPTSMTLNFYDKNYSHLDGWYVPTGSNDHIQKMSPDNAVYARLSGRYRNGLSSPLDTWWFGKVSDYSEDEDGIDVRPKH